MNLLNLNKYMSVMLFCVTKSVNVTGFGKMCIVHTSDFAHSKVYKI